MSVVAKPLIDLNRVWMNGYKILKCFRKEKPVSGELPCPATGLTVHSRRYKNHVAYESMKVCLSCGH